MLLSPRAGPERSPPDLVGALLECHDRIRSFTEIALRLGTREAPDADRAEAARSVVRYFSLALPLHARDEDDSIAPRLARFGTPPEVREAAGRMTREHVPIETLLEVLTPRWEELAVDPSSFAWQAPALEDGARRLQDLFAPHLALEEAIVFPAIPRVLPPAEIEGIRQEMRARRTAR